MNTPWEWAIDDEEIIRYSLSCLVIWIESYTRIRPESFSFDTTLEHYRAVYRHDQKGFAEMIRNVCTVLVENGYMFSDNTEQGRTVFGLTEEGKVMVKFLVL
jgi:hypothetical protein